MRSRSHVHPVGESHGIDLAPMLDFVVNLLIFFLITAVFVKQAGIEVNRPSTVRSDDETTTSKSIVIDERGEISVELKPIDLRTVRAHVERFKAADARTGMVIMADRHAPTGVVGRKLLPAFAAHSRHPWRSWPSPIRSVSPASRTSRSSPQRWPRCRRRNRNPT